MCKETDRGECCLYQIFWEETCLHAVTNAQKDCIFVWFMFKAEICCKVRYLLVSFYSAWHEDMSFFRCGENWRSSSIRLTLFDSICKTESSDLVDNLSGMAYTNCQEEKSPRRCSRSDLVDSLSGMAYTNCQEEKLPRRCSRSEHSTAQHRNSHALWFGT